MLYIAFKSHICIPEHFRIQWTQNKFVVINMDRDKHFLITPK